VQRWLFEEDFGIARRLFQELVDHYQPVGPIEKLHVEIIAECCWKMRRLQIAEGAAIKVAMRCEESSIEETEGESEDRSLLINGLFDDAEKSAGVSGYVDDALLETILAESSAEEWWKNDFLLANQKAKDLSTQRTDGCDLSRQEGMKKAPSALRRRMRAFRERSLKMEVYFDQCEDLRRQPHYAQHLLPSSDVMDNLLRYQTAVERRLYRAIAELERLQRQRLGDAVPTPATLNVNLLSADG